MLETLKVLVMFALLLTLTGVANVMTLQRAVELDVNDELRITYSGINDIYVLTSHLPQDAFVTLVQGSGYSGAIYVKVSRIIRGTYDYIVALYSVSPYVVNVTIVRGGKYVTESLNSPANVTLQLLFRIVVNSTYQSGTSIITQIPTYLKPTTWSLVTMVVIPAFFFTSAILDIRDYSRIKKDRWGIQESIALVMRYALYASFITFIVTLIIALALMMYSQLTYGFLTFDPPSVITPLTLLVASTIGYAICRWKGWYDVVDEE